MQVISLVPVLSLGHPIPPKMLAGRERFERRNAPRMVGWGSAKKAQILITEPSR